MTERERLLNDYFNWILELICGFKYSRNNKPYAMLLSYLYDVEFTYSIGRDANRAEDGIALRYRFGSEYFLDDYVIDDAFNNKPCSILEMMAALALRCDEHIMFDDDEGNRVNKWFWGMIDNLGLSDMDDGNYDPDYVEMVIKRFLNREYSSNGKGGLFTVKDCKKDLRTIEIWYQLCWYLDTIL